MQNSNDCGGNETNETNESIERKLKRKHAYFNEKSLLEILEELAIDWIEGTKRRHARRKILRAIFEWIAAGVSTAVAVLSLPDWAINAITNHFQ